MGSSNNTAPIRSWLVILLLLSFFKEGSSQDDLLATTTATTITSSPTQSPQCPRYREFDTSNPTAPQFGAPDGCRCVEGMQGVDCGFCSSDAPCQVNHDNSHICRTGMVFAQGDTYKAYKCKLHSTLEALFTNGKTDLFFDMEAGTATMSVYNTASINDKHAIDCFLTGCEFVIGGTEAKCARVVCKCTDDCSSWTREIVENMMSNKPVELVVGDDEFDSQLAVKIEGAPFDIEGICNATACTPEVNVTSNLSLNEIDSVWKASATFSLIALVVIVGVFLLLSLCACAPCLMHGNCRRKYANRGSLASTSQEDHDEDEDDLDTEISNGGSATKHALEFRHLSRSVTLRPDQAKVHGSREKMLVNNISGSVESGTLCAIMGPSGAGKSSLLNILAAVENSGNSRISGQILLNGKLQRKGYRKAVAYVQQDDSLYDTLTVLECIEYSAMLRLPRSMTAKDKQAHVRKTLEELHLADIAHNRIGTSGKAGVSGGERKRVSIGMELVSRATVLMLDEPTSGLDSHAANSLINVLSELASRNRIVILSIHQPSMRSFLSMDKILLLGAGRVMYDGKPAEVETYLEDRGFPRPSVESLADHMLDVVSHSGNRLALQGPDACREDYEDLVGHIQDEGDNTENAQETSSSRERGSVLTEIPIIFARTAKDIFRNRELFLTQMIISFVLALFGGAIFNDVSNNLAGFQNRMGAFYFSLSFFAFSSFSSMETFVSSRNIFVRETGSKYHGVFSYFLAKTVLDMFFLRVIPVTIFAWLFYWMMGLRSEPESFVIFWATLVLFNICAGTISICISIATTTVAQANLVAAVWFLIMLLFGGFLVNVETMEPWYSWLKYVSIFYYSFEILMSNELSGLVLSFDAPGYPSLPVYGEVFLKSIGMQAGNQTRDLICLCSLAFGFSVAAYLLLLLRVPTSAARHFQIMRKENVRLAKKINQSEDEDDEEED